MYTTIQIAMETGSRLFIDSHAHLSCAPLFDHAHELIERAASCGIAAIVNVCVDPLSLERGLTLSQKYPYIYHTAATTPHDVAQDGETHFALLEAAARKRLLVAIGETGLDYFYAHSPKDLQRHFCARYIALARELNLPIVFHCRNAFADLYALIDEVAPGHPFLLHCFTGTLEEAKAGLDRGGLISFSGILTFRKSDTLRATAKALPLDRIVLETDAPYLAPQSKRGKTNEPAFLIETAEILATIKNLSFEEIGRQTSANTYHFFRLDLLSL